MKKMVTSFVLLFSLSNPSFSQMIEKEFWEIDTSRHIPNGTKTIYLKNSDFKAACNAILDAGLTIKTKDNDLQFVETQDLKQSNSNDGGLLEMFKASNSLWTPVITIRIKDSVTIIKSKIFSTGFGSWEAGEYQQSKKGKPKPNAFVNAFLYAFKIAKLIGGEMTFSED
jgi:hypothetical protein